MNRHRPVSAADVVDFFHSTTRQIKRKGDVSRLSLSIRFRSNSAVLTPDGEAALTPVGEALRTPDLASSHFAIEAAVRSGDNMALARHQAESVKTYLIERFGIEASRLQADSKSVRDSPVDPDPLSPESRRIDIYQLPH